MTLKSEIYLTLFIILEVVGLLLLLGLVAVRSLPASDELVSEQRMNKAIVEEIVRGERV
jgi:hypothetical protein